MEEMIKHVLSGNCIVYPTTTQPALGCILDSKALDNLYKIKNRDSSLPLSIGVANISQARSIVEVPNDVIDILQYFPDGSLTIILKAIKPLDSRLGGHKVAIRFLADKNAKSLLEKTGPLTATSANMSGMEPLLNCKEAANILTTPEHKVMGYSGECLDKIPSTLISWHTVCGPLESSNIGILREGIVSSKEILKWWMNQTSNSGETLDT
ncbi:MAG: L-threonylcarbamoyladenylate synthase [Euryarchaeota archaeon]|jgi:tRNA threonylcarbamoyl adenosine modification protein (Sua5/YciO/YrdC/YwlC family)|nr:L-threonylcarbamoyladenylate synthase [Euryarchaeota archaeon]MBT7413861.1 L-threonylcarbamoyladenylate synthase [Euryarchaeota archaeon]